jgi:CubicO group peptidase (beta-lactamase class C family)
MEAAAKYSEARRGAALLIVQNGKTIFESYPGKHFPQEVHKIYSGTKGFWVLAALAAEEEGILKLDERVVETIDEWRSDDRKARIRIRELLNLTCGLEPMSRLHADSVPDRNAVALRLPVVATPGERFIYGPSPLQVFDELFCRKLTLHRRPHAPSGAEGAQAPRPRSADLQERSGWQSIARLRFRTNR